MSDDDPFFGSGDGDRTILRPSPGGTRSSQRQPPATPQPAYTPPRPQPGYPPASHRGADSHHSYQPPPGSFSPQAAAGHLGGGVNPLTLAATTLITLIAQLRESSNHPDPQGLFQHVSNEMRQFEAAARANGVAPDHVLAARYILCAAIDETVLNTPWGGQSVWSQQTLLTSLHNDAWGGEKFFQLLDRTIQDPRNNLPLLELMYLLMALGFEGKYRIQERGRAELERIQDSLYQVISYQRGQIEHTLSPRWQGLEDKRMRLARFVPLWVVAAVAAGVLVLLYFGISFSIRQVSDPLTTDISRLASGLGIVEQAHADYVPTAETDLRTLLQPELAAGQLEIRPDPKGQRIVISDTNLTGGVFGSGSAVIQPAVEPVLADIGRALSQVRGRVEIIGHTDDEPMGRFARYRDNWELSEARAATVMGFLADGYVQAERLSSTGMADQAPLRPRPAAGSLSDWRNANRRVEILLHAEAARP